MGNADILIPGKVDGVDIPMSAPVPEEYLKIDNALSEIADSGAQATARNHLDVYSTTDTEELINEAVHDFVHKLNSLKSEIDANKSEGQESYDRLTSQLDDMSTKEELNTLKKDLTNKITNALKGYLTSAEVTNRIAESLVDYVTKSEVYLKGDLYNQKEINKMLLDFVKKDGSTPFTSTQDGVYPKTRKNLATKGYADDCMKNHKNEADPHNYTTILNSKLNNYYKKSEVYTKAQTYDRTAIDSMVERLVKEAIDSVIDEHIAITPHLTSQDVLRVIKNYVSSNDLISENDCQSLIDSSIKGFSETLKTYETVWTTSGPVRTTVGFVEDNQDVPATFTLQEIMDAIFYGKKVDFTVTESVMIGETAEITLCLHGITDTDQITIKQEDKIIFETGSIDDCITIDSEELVEDTDFTVEIIYSSGQVHTETKTCKVEAPCFVGLLPKWKFGNYVTYDYLQELIGEEPTNNKFFIGDEVTIHYKFEDPKLRLPFVVVPITHANLYQMTTSSQQFGSDAFEKIISMPLDIKGIKLVDYKVFIYKQGLSVLDLPVTFTFA